MLGYLYSRSPSGGGMPSGGSTAGRPTSYFPVSSSSSSRLGTASAEALLSACREVNESLRVEIADMMRELAEDMRRDVREELQHFKPESQTTLQTTLQEPIGSGWARRSSTAGQITKLLDQKPAKRKKKPRRTAILEESELLSHSDFDPGGSKAVSREITEELSPQPLGGIDNLQEVFLPRLMPEERTNDDNDHCLDPGAVSHTKTCSLQESCKLFVTSRPMEMSVATLVLLNSASIGFQTEYQSNNMDGTVPAIFLLIDTAFCILFSIELVLRIFAFGFSFFSNADWAWNVFDSFIVSMLLVDLLSTLVWSQDGDNSKSRIGNQLSILRILRILRVFRAIRIVRVLRFVEELRTITVCMMCSMRSLGWTLLLLFVVIYIVGICVTQIVLEHRTEVGPDEISKEIMEGFGSLSRTCLTLYEVITEGNEWHGPMVALSGDISWCFVVFWILYIAFSMFAMLNVVTGVFVEKAMEFAQRDKAEYMMNHICDIFRETIRRNRKDGEEESANITWSQFEQSLETEEMQEYFKAIDVDTSEARGLFDLLDVERRGTIDAVEFISGCVRLTGNAKALDLALVLSESRALRLLVVAELKSIRAQLGRTSL
eukprot:TRINITY_DN3810_c0_g2_i1.p1 TRINITY_DN3810_c0_g2~~TRINITY_DN3810_c0_g2_i1.p1  ORF type:complete len:603 (+),score=124.96 TRINITY_DN3810_c0_g2_i1:119-1927(+)